MSAGFPLLVLRWPLPADLFIVGRVVYRRPQLRFYHGYISGKAPRRLGRANGRLDSCLLIFLLYCSVSALDHPRGWNPQRCLPEKAAAALVRVLLFLGFLGFGGDGCLLRGCLVLRTRSSSIFLLVFA